MEQKQLRLFGFEVNPYTEGDGFRKGIEEGDGSGKSLDKVFCKIERTVKNKSSIGVSEHKKYECQFCLKEFMNSQALGGHQNAHKKERQKKRRMKLQAKSDSFNFFLEPPQSCSVFNSHHSLPCFDDFSTCVPEFSLHKESLISFNPADQNQNLYCNISHVSKSIALSSNNRLEQDTCSRPVVIKPSPSYISKDCQSLYIQLGLAQKPDICSSSRRGCNRVG